MPNYRQDQNNRFKTESRSVIKPTVEILEETLDRVTIIVAELSGENISLKMDIQALEKRIEALEKRLPPLPTDS